MIYVFELLLLFSKIFLQDLTWERHRHQVVIYKFIAIFYTEILLDEKKLICDIFFSWRNKQEIKYVNNHSHTYLESLSYGFWLFISWVSIHCIENIHRKKMHINVQCIITYSFAIKIKIRQSWYASMHFEYYYTEKKSSYIAQCT